MYFFYTPSSDCLRTLHCCMIVLHLSSVVHWIVENFARELKTVAWMFARDAPIHKL